MTLRIAIMFIVLALPAGAQASPPPEKSAPPIAEKVAAPSKPALDPSLIRLFGNYGGWWKTISETEKDAFIDGYTTAMLRANSLTVALCQAKMKEAQPGATNFNEKLYGGTDLCFVSQEFAFKVDKPLKPQLDEFYKEPLNARIPADYAMIYARDQLAGKKTAGQLLDELNDWRKIMNSEHGKN